MSHLLLWQTLWKRVQGLLRLAQLRICLLAQRRLLCDDRNGTLSGILEFLLVLYWLFNRLRLVFIRWIYSVLRTDFVVLKQSLKNLHALVVALLAEEIADLKDLVFD